MFSVPRNQLRHFQINAFIRFCSLCSEPSSTVNCISCLNFVPHLASSFMDSKFSQMSSHWNSALTQIPFSVKRASFAFLPRSMSVSSFSSNAFCRIRGPPSRSLRRRMSRRAKAAARPVLDEAQFHRAISQLPPRFAPEELCNVISTQQDPLVCLELFNWASKQHRFRHNASTFHVTIKKLGAAKMYEEMDYVVNQVLAIPFIGYEALYNTMIYYFTEARKLTRAVNIFKHMKNSKKLDCRPSIRTYNLLFSALLSRGKNSYVNHMYMETIRTLFKQMVDDGIEPDIFSLNSMIKGYVLSLHVNDALRIFHQMGVVYSCPPNAFSYDYLLHGLCAQGRTVNAQELCNDMKEKGFIPSSKSYNSIVNALALAGEVDAAVMYLWEMHENERSADFITYRTVIDEICRHKSTKDAKHFLKELHEKNLINGRTYDHLWHEIEGGSGNYNLRNRFRCVPLIHSLTSYFVFLKEIALHLCF